MAETKSPPIPLAPCEKCGSTKHTTDGHFEGTGPAGHHDDGGYPTTIGTEKVYENRPTED